MTSAIYKPGQGYWTRLMSAIGLSLIVLMGVVWLWKLLATVRLFGMEPVYGQAGVALLVIVVFGAVGYRLIGRSPRVVEFMIAVESEMKKVNWSSRKEIIGSTWLVVGLTACMAIFCFSFDFVFQQFFSWIKVLET